MFERIKKIMNFDILGNAMEFSNTLMNKESKIYCQKCERLLPIFRLVLKSKSCKNNQIFQFKCKCGNINMIKKEVIK